MGKYIASFEQPKAGILEVHVESCLVIWADNMDIASDAIIKRWPDAICINIDMYYHCRNNYPKPTMRLTIELIGKLETFDPEFD